MGFRSRLSKLKEKYRMGKALFKGLKDWKSGDLHNYRLIRAGPPRDSLFLALPAEVQEQIYLRVIFRSPHIAILRSRDFVMAEIQDPRGLIIPNGFNASRRMKMDAEATLYRNCSFTLPVGTTPRMDQLIADPSLQRIRSMIVNVGKNIAIYVRYFPSPTIPTVTVMDSGYTTQPLHAGYTPNTTLPNARDLKLYTHFFVTGIDDAPPPLLLNGDQIIGHCLVDFTQLMNGLQTVSLIGVYKPFLSYLRRTQIYHMSLGTVQVSVDQHHYNMLKLRERDLRILMTRLRTRLIASHPALPPITVAGLVR